MGTDSLSNPSEEISVLVEQARGGHCAAFEKIVSRYQGLISGMLFSATGDFHRSEDLAQETFLIAWNRLGELKNAENPAPWLCTIAKNLAHRSFRKKSESPAANPEFFEENLQQKESSDSDPAREMLRKEQSELVWSAIGEIPESYRETLVLYYRSGQSVKEIAVATDSSIEAVNQRLLRARKSLKSRLEKMVGDILGETAPDGVFTFSVISAIASGAVVSTGQTVLAASTGSVGTVAASSSTAGKTVGFASFWAVLGPFAFLVWYLSFLWCIFYLSIRNLPTLRSRRFRTYILFRGIQYYPLFYGLAMIPMGILILRTTSSGPLFMLAVMVFGLAFFGREQFFYMKKLKEILKADLGLPHQEVKTYTFDQVQRRFHLALFTNLLLAETLFAVGTGFAVFEGIDATTFLVALVYSLGTILTAIAAYYLGKHLLELSRSSRSVVQNPPVVENPFAGILQQVEKPSLFLFSKKAKKTYCVMLCGWICFGIAAACFLRLFINWNLYPLEKIGCITLLVGSCIAYGFIPRKCLRRRSQFRILTAGMFLFDALILLYFGTLEADSLSLREVFQNLSQGRFSFGPVQNWALTTSLFFIVMVFFHTLLWVYESFQGKSSQPQGKKDENTPDPIREAVQEFEWKQSRLFEEKTCEEDEGFPKSFPRKWFWICVVYGAVICSVFLLGMLFTSPTARKNILLRNENYTALIALEPDNPEYYYLRGNRERLPEKAIKDLDLAIHLKPDYAEAYHARAKKYADLETCIEVGTGESSEDRKYRLHKALEDINKAVELEPQSHWFLSSRAGILSGLERYEAAIEDLCRAITLVPPSQKRFYTGYYIQRAFLYKQIGEYQNALKDFTEAIRLEKLAGNGDFSEIFQRDMDELREKLRSSE